MNKKILGISFVLVIAALLIAPVFADPTQGPNKKAVTMTQVPTGIVPGGPYMTGPITHNQFGGLYDVTIEIKDGATVESTLVGEAVVDRKLVAVPQKGSILGRWIFADYYVITIETVDGGAVVGGFEGNGNLIMDGVNPAGPGVITWEKARAKGLFHGTGDFEGQTLNFNTPWTPYGTGDIVWDGYLLKP